MSTPSHPVGRSTHRVVASLVVMLAVSACSSDPASPNSASRLIDGAAVAETGVATYPVVVTHNSGIAITAVADPSTGRLTGAVAASAAGELVVYSHPDGRPREVVAGGSTYFFENYTSTTVDIARVDADGQVVTARAVALPSNIPEYGDHVAGDSPWTASATARMDPAQVRQALAFVGTALATFACVKATILTAGLAIVPCGYFLLNVVPRLLAAEDTRLGQTASAVETVGSSVGCFTRGDPESCLSTIVSIAEMSVADASAVAQSNASARAGGLAHLRFGGSWAYRSLSQSFLVVEPSGIVDVLWSSSTQCYTVTRATMVQQSGVTFTWRRELDAFEIRAEMSSSNNGNTLTIRRLNDGRLFVFDRVSLDVDAVGPRCAGSEQSGIGWEPEASSRTQREGLGGHAFLTVDVGVMRSPTLESPAVAEDRTP